MAAVAMLRLVASQHFEAIAKRGMCGGAQLSVFQDGLHTDWESLNTGGILLTFFRVSVKITAEAQIFGLTVSFTRIQFAGGPRNCESFPKQQKLLKLRPDEATLVPTNTHMFLFCVHWFISKQRLGDWGIFSNLLHLSLVYKKDFPVQLGYF